MVHPAASSLAVPLRQNPSAAAPTAELREIRPAA
jgi:hypothetical protein